MTMRVCAILGWTSGVLAVTAALAQIATLPPLRIAGNMTTIELAPVLIAAGGGYRGRITVVNGGIPDLVRGEVDAATNAETQFLRRSAEDTSLRIIFTEAESFYRVVARRSAGIKSPADLRGKRVAVAPFTSAHYYLVKSLTAAGVPEESVTAVPVSPITKMPGMLANREVDAVAIWEPVAEDSVAALGSDAIVFQDRRLYRELFNLQTSTRVLNEPAKRAALVELLRSLITASSRLREKPRDLWPVFAPKLNYSEAVIEKSWPQLRYAGSLAPDLLDVMAEEEIWVAKEKQRTPRTRDQLSGFIDRSLLDEALRSLKK